MEGTLQVTMINLLTRYARSQFADPELASQPDVDIALLLNSARPLLQVSPVLLPVQETSFSPATAVS